MSFYGNRQLGRYGSGVMGSWGAFAGGGRAIFGPFSFAESWSSDDFENAAQFNSWVKPYLAQVSRTGMTWDPPSAASLSKASQAWGAWKNASDLGSADAAAYIASVTSQMNDLISRADALSLTGTSGHRSEANEVSRYDVFNQIRALVVKVSASMTAANNAAASAVASDAASMLAPPGIPQTGAVVYPSTTSGGGAGVLGMSQGAATAAPAADDNTMLYLALAGGAVVLVGGFFFLRKKKASVAGYRRRKKSRRSRR